jgi:hypothetical protein
MVLKRETLGRKKKSGESRRIRLAGKPGFEPRFHDPESCVLPLDDFPAGPRIILEFLAFFNHLNGVRSQHSTISSMVPDLLIVET